MPLFCFQRKNVKVDKEMKQKKTIGSSIGLLIGVVIAILAFVRGVWQLPLLIGAFAVAPMDPGSPLPPHFAGPTPAGTDGELQPLFGPDPAPPRQLSGVCLPKGWLS